MSKKKISVGANKTKPQPTNVSKNQKQVAKTSADWLEPQLQRYGLWLLIATILVVGFVAFSDYLFFNKVYFFKDIGSDEINGTYPLWKQQEYLSHESGISSWSFYQGMGYPIIWSYFPNPAILVNSVIINISGAAEAAEWRFWLTFVFYMLLAGIIAFLYFRTMGISYVASWAGAFMFAFAGHTVLGSSWAHGERFLIGIFLLFAFEQLFMKKRWYFFPLAIVVASPNPFYLYLFGLFLFLYSLIRFTDEHELKDFRLYFKLLAKMIGLGALGLLINTINITSVYPLLFNSPRVAGNASAIPGVGKAVMLEMTNFPERLTALYRLFSNDLLGNGSYFRGWYNYLEAPIFYIGLINLLLLPQVFIYMSRKSRIAYGLFGGFLLLAVLFPYLRKALHLFVGNYYKGVFDFMIGFSLLFMSIRALDTIYKQGKIHLITLLVTSFVCILVLTVPDLPDNTMFPGQPVMDKSLRNVILFFLVVQTVLLALARFISYRTVAFVGLLLIVVFELSYMASITVNKRETYTAAEFKTEEGGFNDGTPDVVKTIKTNDQSFFRIEKDYRSGTSMHRSLNDAQAQGFFSTPNYGSFNHLPYINFLEGVDIIKAGDESSSRWAPGLRDRPVLQSLMGVKYRLSNQKNAFYQFFLGYDTVSLSDKILVLKNKNYLPMGVMYRKAVSRSDFDKLPPTNNFAQERFFRPEDTKALNTWLTPKDIVMLEACVVDDATITSLDVSKYNIADTVGVSKWQNYLEKYSTGVANLRKDTMQITSWKNNRFEGSIEVDTAGILFLSIPYHEGWHAKVNGTEEKIMQVNIGFCGIYLGAGKHNIEISHEPAYYVASITGSLVGILLFAAMLAGGIIYNRRNSKKANTTT